MANLTYRATTGLKLRADAAGKTNRTAGGCFSAYGNCSTIDDWFQEVISPYAFAESVGSGVCRSLNNAPIKALYQHNIENVLASCKNGTLRLTEADNGLMADADLIEDSLGDRVLAMVQRGDLDEASIGFFPVDTQWAPGKQMDILNITRGDLKEVSFAHWPKTQSSAISMRAALPDEVKEKPLVLRAINRFKHSTLEPDDRDKEILCVYRSLIEPVLDEDSREVLRKALPPAQKIIPVETMQAYLDNLPKWR